VWRSLGPLALGHALAIGATLLIAAALGIVIPLSWMKWAAAAALLGFGLVHLLRHGHGRRSGMRVGPRDMTVWSFLVASAHGAGLMALPVVLRLTTVRTAHAMNGAADHGSHLELALLPGADALALLATLVHTAGYLTVAGSVAWVVYAKLGLRRLRSVWLNLDFIWAVALIVTAVLTPLL
jgi:hypothetical protein